MQPARPLQITANIKKNPQRFTLPLRYLAYFFPDNRGRQRPRQALLVVNDRIR
ncbi:hypothetical protein HMPREF0495_01807 [Levilactobacillus brevis ATCC 14869 = DSM 20054]|uniref:Uncharacterized protein n=1 Tax=Levilactobacillus brevis ATCC 14869 = DSM 20054 TaxID=649758 RepID=U2PEZ0_LEVBR|nr:hypothetical protein HMPREF0495_01807 [Levilactobacillus brevis ATCC 14869 = DSM 20054]